MISIKTPARFIEAIILDITSIPGIFMTKEKNAKWHLNHVCPRCSSWRKSFRDPKRGICCIWEKEWRAGNTKIHRSFGLLNWIKYYLGIKTNLKKYKF